MLVGVVTVCERLLTANCYNKLRTGEIQYKHAYINIIFKIINIIIIVSMRNNLSASSNVSLQKDE